MWILLLSTKSFIVLYHMRKPGSVLFSIKWTWWLSFCHFVDYSFFHPSPLFSPHPFNPLTLDKREKRVEGEGKRSLNKVRGQKESNILLTTDFQVPWGKFDLAVRISSFFLLFLLCLGLTATNNNQQTNNNTPPCLSEP